MRLLVGKASPHAAGSALLSVRTFRNGDDIKDCLSFVCPLMIYQLFPSCLVRGELNCP